MLRSEEEQLLQEIHAFTNITQIFIKMKEDPQFLSLKKTLRAVMEQEVAFATQCFLKRTQAAAEEPGEFPIRSLPDLQHQCLQRQPLSHIIQGP